MTISSEVNKSGPYSGNGVTTVFDYDFKIVDETHLLVIETDVATNDETTLVLATDYTVSDVGEPTGGQVTVSAAPATGKLITILLNVPFTQETDLENQGAYYAETVESALDLAVQRDLQLKELVDRAVKIPPTQDPIILEGLVADIVRLADSADNIDIVGNNIEAVNNVATNMPDVITVADLADELEALAAEVNEDSDSAAASAAAAALSALEAAQQVTNVTPSVVRFSGDGVDTTFDLGTGEIDENLTAVYISGVYQQKDTYSVAAGVLTFSSAPPAGSGNIEVVIAGNVAMAAAIPTDESVSAAKLTGGLSAMFAKRGDAVGAVIPPSMVSLRTNGYAAAGDGGGALYKRVVSEPAHAGKLQTTDGAWWEIVLEYGMRLDARAVGAVMDMVYDGSGVASGTDDTVALRNAIGVVAAKGGGEVVISGRMMISDTVLIDDHGVNLVGLGAMWAGGLGGINRARSKSASVIAFDPTAVAAKMIRFSDGLVDNGGQARIRGGGIRGILIDGQAKATRGVELISVISMRFEDAWAVECTEVGWLLGAFATESSSGENMTLGFNKFYGCGYSGAAGLSLVLSGTERYNSAYNEFFGFTGNQSAGSTIHLEDCDSNKFFAVTGNLTLHGGGTGSYSTPSTPGLGIRAARVNTIVGYEGLITAKAAAPGNSFPSHGNVVYGISMDTSLLPVIEAGADITVNMSGLDKSGGHGSAVFGEAFAGTICGLSASTVTVPNASTATVTWHNGGGVLDILDAWTSGEPARLVVPPGVKYVRLSAAVTWEPNATGVRYVDIRMNGISANKWALDARPAVPSFATVNKAETAWIRVQPGDYFTVHAHQTSGGNLNILLDVGTRFQMEMK